MQLLKSLTAIILCVAGVSAIPSGYDTNSELQRREDHTSQLAKRVDPTIGAELKYYNAQSGVPAGGLTVGLHLFQGTLPRDKSGDSAQTALIVAGMDAAQANHHYLIGVTVSDTESGPPKKRVTTRDAKPVVAWDMSVTGTDKDTTVLSKSSIAWDRARAPKVTYRYIKKTSKAAPAINTLGKQKFHSN